MDPFSPLWGFVGGLGVGLKIVIFFFPGQTPPFGLKPPRGWKKENFKKKKKEETGIAGKIFGEIRVFSGEKTLGFPPQI